MQVKTLPCKEEIIQIRRRGSIQLVISAEFKIHHTRWTGATLVHLACVNCTFVNATLMGNICICQFLSNINCQEDNIFSGKVWIILARQSRSISQFCNCFFFLKITVIDFFTSETLTEYCEKKTWCNNMKNMTLSKSLRIMFMAFSSQWQTCGIYCSEITAFHAEYLHFSRLKLIGKKLT